MYTSRIYDLEKSRLLKVGFFLFWFMLISVVICDAQTESTVLTPSKTSSFKTFVTPSDTFSKPRFWGLTGVAALTYGGAMAVLNQAWYADFPRSKLHSFDDTGEWLNMDKYGHFYSAYFQSQYVYYAYRWTGANNKQSVLMSAIWSTTLQTTIEVMDGYSAQWGFSFADLAMNTAGTGLFAAQQLLWEEQRVLLKFSAHTDSYSRTPIVSNSGNASDTEARRANEEFGTDNVFEQLLKDYNGTTIWVSGNPMSFFPEQQTKIPKWLNLAVGIGAENLLGAFGNNWSYEGETFQGANSRNRYQQYFVSLDVDFTRIRTNNKLLKTLFVGLNAFKIPAPTLELSDGTSRFHIVYF